MKNREIYQHIADTYLGKRTKSKSKKRKWFVLIAVISGVILITALFLAKGVISHSKNKGASVYLLSERYPLRLVYDLKAPNLGIKNFSFSLPRVDVRKYNKLNLRIRGDKFSGFTKILKIEIGNSRQEKDSYYIKDISNNWEDFSIKISDFKNIRDWSKINRLSFIFEDWNVSRKSGIIYIDNLRFSE